LKPYKGQEKTKLNKMSRFFHASRKEHRMGDKLGALLVKLKSVERDLKIVFH